MSRWSSIFGGTPSTSTAPSLESPPPEDPRLHRPTTREELVAWCCEFVELQLPSPVCVTHKSAGDYLHSVFFETSDRDPLIWACRGGGKTLIGAVATLLDMLFKPGIEIRIMGGSLEQAHRMYEHLTRMVNRNFGDQLSRNPRLGRITDGGFSFANGSRVEILAQSEKAARGTRVQKVRCDEVDLFEPGVWNALQLTTQSKQLPDGRTIRGSIEAFSTLNSPTLGFRSKSLMHKLIESNSRELFAWCLWDVMERCTEDCSACPIQKDCLGRAKVSNGHITRADVLAQKERVHPHVWAYEMLCEPGRVTQTSRKVEVRYY